MTEKEKATEMVSKNFSIIAKHLRFKGLNGTKNEKQFKDIENVAKKCALIGVDGLIQTFIQLSMEESGTTHIDFGHGYWEKVKIEIEKL